MLNCEKSVAVVEKSESTDLIFLAKGKQKPKVEEKKKPKKQPKTKKG